MPRTSTEAGAISSSSPEVICGCRQGSTRGAPTDGPPVRRAVGSAQRAAGANGKKELTRVVRALGEPSCRAPTAREESVTLWARVDVRPADSMNCDCAFDQLSCRPVIR
jgi:hypothetical protein